MSIRIQRLDQRRYADDKMQKLNLFQTERFFLDVDCLEPGQGQKPHAHAGSDKVYAVLEGKVAVRVGDEEKECIAGEAVLAPAGEEHGLENRSAGRAAVLVFMSPPP